MTSAPASVHLYVLLDRSGSMNAIRDDVIGGFNGLLAEQAQQAGPAVMTLVQFDSHDPHEVLADAVPMAEMVELTPATFVPRGGTPLLDATGLLVSRASQREAERAGAGLPAEDITVVTITDGHENQSHEYSRQQIVDLVKAREASGWTFVFLGAGLDAYAEAEGMGYDPRSVQAWLPDADGSRLAMRSTSRAMAERRRKLREGEAVDRADFFEGSKTAEDDLRRRRRPGSA